MDARRRGAVYPGAAADESDRGPLPSSPCLLGAAEHPLLIQGRGCTSGCRWVWASHGAYSFSYSSPSAADSLMRITEPHHPQLWQEGNAVELDRSMSQVSRLS